MTELKRITQEELDEILRLHELWIESKHEEGEKADLRDADLRDADLRDAYLREAYLTGADFREADLTGADLTGADISHLTKQEFLDSVYINENTNLTNVKFKEDCKEENNNFEIDKGITKEQIDANRCVLAKDLESLILRIDQIEISLLKTRIYQLKLKIGNWNEEKKQLVKSLEELKTLITNKEE